MANNKFLIPILIACIVTAGIFSYVLIAYLQPLQVAIKDAPYDDLVSINVDIAAIDIHNEDEGRWIPLVSCTCELNCSVNGNEEKICDHYLTAGTYDLIRIKFNHIRLRFNNDSLYEINKFENQNMIQNFWLEIPIDFVYDGTGGKVLFDVTINDNYEAVVTIVQATA